MEPGNDERAGSPANGLAVNLVASTGGSSPVFFLAVQRFLGFGNTGPSQGGSL